VAHVVLSGLFTWPLVLNLLPGAGTQVPGTLIVDRDQNLWNLWWTRHALLAGRNPFVTDFIWYPTGVNLYFHTLNVFNGMLAVPLLSVFSLTTTYNIIVLFSFVVGGYGAFLLVHYLCGNRWAALTGSVVFAYSAYHIATMRGLLQLISLEWVPFFVLFLLKAVYDVPRHTGLMSARWLVRGALPAGLALLLVSLVDWYYTMYCLLFAGLLALYLPVRYLWAARAAGTRPADGSVWAQLGRPLGRIGVVLVLYLVLVSPILVPTIRELRTASYAVPQPDEPLRFSADLLAFFQPPRFHKLWGGAFTNRDAWPFANNTYEVYLTYTVLFLAGVALFAVRSARPMLSSPETHTGPSVEPPSPIRAGLHAGAHPPGKWFWAACALTFFLLALGPVLQVNGHQVRGLPMPYLLVSQVPVLNISRSPDRFSMPLTLCLGVLAGYGTNVLAQTCKPLGAGSSAPVVALGAVALMVLELAPMPYPQRTADIPQWYRLLGRETGDFSIFELPPQDDYWHGAFRMYNQTAHGKRIFWGYISREYPHPFTTSTPGYQELVYADGHGDMLASSEVQRLSAFALYSTKYVVLQKKPKPDLPGPAPSLDRYRQAIEVVLGGVAPSYEDAHVAVYTVPAPAERMPFLSVGEGWQPREVGPNGAFRWMGRRATLRIDSPEPQEAYLVFRATTVGPARRLQIYHGDHLVFDDTVSALREYRTAGPLGLPAGVSVLSFVSPDGTVSPAQLGIGDDPRQLSFAVLDARLERVRGERAQQIPGVQGSAPAGGVGVSPACLLPLPTIYSLPMEAWYKVPTVAAQPVDWRLGVSRRERAQEYAQV
jgi:hypothetical protein